jgi:hypothetical protein
MSEPRKSLWQQIEAKIEAMRPPGSIERLCPCGTTMYLQPEDDRRICTWCQEQAREAKEDA